MSSNDEQEKKMITFFTIFLDPSLRMTLNTLSVGSSTIQYKMKMNV
jgi:hypothetical protein